MLCKIRWTASQPPALRHGALTACLIDQNESIQETHLHFSYSTRKALKQAKIEALSLIIVLFCTFCYRFL